MNGSSSIRALVIDDDLPVHVAVRRAVRANAPDICFPPYATADDLATTTDKGMKQIQEWLPHIIFLDWHFGSETKNAKGVVFFQELVDFRRARVDEGDNAKYWQYFPIVVHCSANIRLDGTIVSLRLPENSNDDLDDYVDIPVKLHELEGSLDTRTEDKSYKIAKEDVGAGKARLLELLRRLERDVTMRVLAAGLSRSLPTNPNGQSKAAAIRRYSVSLEELQKSDGFPAANGAELPPEDILAFPLSRLAYVRSGKVTTGTASAAQIYRWVYADETNGGALMLTHKRNQLETKVFETYFAIGSLNVLLISEDLTATPGCWDPAHLLRASLVLVQIDVSTYVNLWRIDGFYNQAEYQTNADSIPEVSIHLGGNSRLRLKVAPKFQLLMASIWSYLEQHNLTFEPKVPVSSEAEAKNRSNINKFENY